MRRLIVPAGVWAGLVVLLLVAALTPGHFGDPAAPYRLVAYPVLALVLPAIWSLSRTPRPLPAFAATLVMVPFVVDTIGNLGDLYARISWFDDVAHFTNWLLLSAGIGLALAHEVQPRWALTVLIVGLGSLLALGWELGELAFFYDPPYSPRLYEDTLADQSLGTAGAVVAGLLVATVRRVRPPDR